MTSKTSPLSNIFDDISAVFTPPRVNSAVKKRRRSRYDSQVIKALLFAQFAALREARDVLHPGAVNQPAHLLQDTLSIGKRSLIRW